MKLTTKILLLLVAVVVLVTFVAGTISVRSTYASLTRQQELLTRQLADDMEDMLTDAYRRAGPRGVDRAVHDWIEQSEKPLLLEFVLFSDTDRQLMPRVPREVWPVLRRGEIFSLVSVDTSGNRNLHTYLPVGRWDGELGALELTQPLSALDEQARQLVLGTLLAMLASALMGLAIAWVAGVRWVAQPLTTLIQQTQRIGRGDFTTRTELNSGDELDELAQALNSMSQQLAEQQDTIQRETQDRVAALEQLRHAERLGTLGRMAAGLAHEVGTPLNVVAGRAALIASGKLPAEEVTSSARTIKAEADRITSIMQRMLDFARQRPPHSTDCDLRALVRRTIQLVETLAEKKQIALSMRETDDLPTICKVDEAQIQQVLTNLIVNAIQATPIGGVVEVSLTREGTPPGQRVVIRVDDSGPGVPADLRERIFEPFFTTKDVGEGTGLGLSIAYGIVQEHRGELVVGDSPSGGARFEIRLPAASGTGSYLHGPAHITCDPFKMS